MPITRNIENIKKVLDHIEAHPETWNQKSWHCGTTHCFAGWGQLMAGKPMDDDNARTDARIFFGFNFAEANFYFDSNRTLPELKTALDPAAPLRDSRGLDADGFDIDGFDLEGFSEAGFNREGFSRIGFDKDGYNRDGYDMEGLDRDNNPRPKIGIIDIE